MTVQEAIKYLRMATGEAEGYCDEYREMCEMSIEALEKQKGYRPINVYQRPNGNYGECFKCGKQLLRSSNYCPRCGYLILWEEGGTSD